MLAGNGVSLASFRALPGCSEEPLGKSPLKDGKRQNRDFIHRIPPTVEIVGAHLDPVSCTLPHPLWTCETFHTCDLLKHTLMCGSKIGCWAEEMETLHPDSHLPVPRKSPKTPSIIGTHPLAQLPQVPGDG